MTLEPESRRLLDSITLKINERVGLKLYSDSRPYCLEIAPLQKGLVLMLDGRDLIEEGIGFGVPVVKYEDKTYFSCDAETLVRTEGETCIMMKSFLLNSVSHKRIGDSFYVNDRLYSRFHKSFEKVYLRHASLSFLFNRIMEFRKTMRVSTDFVKVKPRGKVTVSYTCCPDYPTIKIQAHISDLDCNGCKEILILNEQGSTFFSRYSDTDGLRLRDGEIRAWEKIEANRASLSDSQHTLSFTMKNVPNAIMLRGREKTKGRFSWAGMSYSLDPSVRTLTYDIVLDCRKNKNVNLETTKLFIS